ncbi:protein adenylyltransferase SelO-1, mitochondrial-like isoform X4 [Ornithodoros turicata]|uniref:protein adenylyltransferase SelO-1, mitochondrial-like isoform X4 n=1 Tax=Ornithodoros turicata TaxID=34597 RepID=UPI003139B512
MLLSKTTRYKEIITPLIRACCRISLNVRCTMATFETLKFDNLALRVLPIDTEERNYVRTVRGACFSRVNPMPVKSPEIVAISESAMLLLDLPRSELERKEAVEYLSGNKLLPGSETASHCYCGHQFGYFAGQLGDGAAIYLGEVINHKGERWEIQLKGAGLTPYSRDADGRKVLRSTIREFLCSEIHQMYTNNQQEKYKAFFKEVLKKTAALVAGWQCVGFCHGVLNTDNMSITGLTLDYGPFGFLDWFDPDHICNSSDDGGRYTYIKQPEICLWNLRKFAEAIQGALPLSETSPILDMYNNEYEKCFLGRMRQKFGLLNKELQSDKDLVTSFYDAMESTGADFTRAFRCLSSLAVPGHVDHEESKKIVKGKLLSCSSSHCDMLERAKRSFKSRDFQLFLLLSQSNPELLDQLGKGMIARERIESQLKKAEKLMEISAEDMERRKDEVWSHWIDRYCERLHQEIDIGVDLHVLQLRRVQAMNSSNPRFILRNHIAQRAIEMAENGDYSEVVKVLKILEKPFSDDPLDLKAAGAAVCPAVFDEGFYEGRYALSAPPLRVSCSS